MMTEPSPGSVSSTLTMASAPAGIGAPVMILIASPGPTRRVGTLPAGTSSMTVSVAGVAVTSSDRTAYPSIAELSNGGMSWEAMTSAASTNPEAVGERRRHSRKGGHGVEHLTLGIGKRAHEKNATCFSLLAARFRNPSGSGNPSGSLRHELQSNAKQRRRRCRGGGRESNPPRSFHPFTGFEDRGAHQALRRLPGGGEG